MKKCKNCRNDLPQANLFCSHCGAAQEVIKKPTRWIGIVFAVVLIGVVATIYFGKDNFLKKETEDASNEIPLKSNETEEGVENEHDLLIVKKTKQTMSIEELEKSAFYSSVVQSGSDEAKVFIVPTTSDGLVTFGPDDISFMGVEGDDVYTGFIQLYLVEIDGDKGYLQKGNDEETMLNLTREPFQSYTIDGKTMITVHEAVTSNHFEMSLWGFDKGQMNLVDTLGTSTTKLKIIEDKYIQTYSYDNGDPLGWTFYTYEWSPVKSNLGLIDTYDLTIDDDVYDREAYFDSYKEVVDEWNTLPHAYVAFPYISIQKDFVKQLNRGTFLGKKIPLGESIDSFIKKHPNHLGTDYYEGGKYYGYPSGELYFFDENTGKINHFAYGAGSLETTVTELIELIGDPVDDTGDISEDDPAYDYYIENLHMMTFDLGKFDVSVEYEDDEIIFMWFNLK